MLVLPCSLLGGGLTVSSADAAKSLREILDSHVELRPAVRSINLNGAMRDGLIGPYFRRVAALFRHTPNLRTLQFVHVGLSEKASQMSSKHTYTHTPFVRRMPAYTSLSA